MLKFKNIELSDKPVFDCFFGKENFFISDYCFANVYIWRNVYHTQYACENGFLYVKFNDGESDSFLPPIGDGDYKQALEELIAYTNGRLLIGLMPPKYKLLMQEAMPGRFDISESRDSANYIYSAEKLMYLKGKKLHAKRNHINKFMLTHSNWSYEELNDQNTREFFDYQLYWCADDPDEFLGETCAVSAALKNREALDIKGGLLRLDGRIIAITLGSQTFSDTFTVHIEKADPNIQGAYQMINQQFALNNFEKYTYINREEDLGIEGLRKAKLSYFPEFLSENYMAVFRQ